MLLEVAELTSAHHVFPPNCELISTEMSMKQQKGTKSMNRPIVWLKNAKKNIKTNYLFYHITFFMFHPVYVSLLT